MARQTPKLTMTVFGALGQDPTSRVLENGDQVTNMNLAVNRPYTDQQGVRHDRTDWFRIVAWGSGGGGLAKVCNDFLRKGREILVEGIPNANAWIDGEGQVQSQIEINANSIVFARNGQMVTAEASPADQAAGDETEIPF